MTDGPLSGIVVLDLTQGVAGPYATKYYADYGADVIKVDDPNGGGPSPDVSRGKRSILLDLKQPAGRDALWKLVLTPLSG